VVTTIYEAVATEDERAHFRPPGRLVDVGGYQLHLRCEGQGSPTVVLESGGGMTSNEWTLVQPDVAKFTRVCSYDRAGLGWSESGPPADPVEVLHALLRNASVPGPYAIVGHSYGSGLVLRFAYRFSNEVKGMVLTAASYPDEEVQRISAETRIRGRSYFEMYAWSTRLGLMRITPERYLPDMLRVYFGSLRHYLPPRTAECEIAFLLRPDMFNPSLLKADTRVPTKRSRRSPLARTVLGICPWLSFPRDGFIRLLSMNRKRRRHDAKMSGKRDWRDYHREDTRSTLRAVTLFRWRTPLRSSMPSDV